MKNSRADPNNCFSIYIDDVVKLICIDEEEDSNFIK